jgi:hypothetical protein
LGVSFVVAGGGLFEPNLKIVALGEEEPERALTSVGHKRKRKRVSS